MVIRSALHVEGRRFEPGRKEITFVFDETIKWLPNSRQYKLLSHASSENKKKEVFKEYLCYLRYTAVSGNFVLQILSANAYRALIPNGALGSVRIPLVSQLQREIY